MTGEQIIQFHNKQNVSFKGSEANFPRYIFPASASNEDTFDRKMIEEIKNPDKKSFLEVLIKERTGLSQEQLNSLSNPATLNGGLLGEIVQNGKSVLHKNALDKYNAAIEKLKDQSQRDYEETMATVDFKLNKEIAESFQITQTSHNVITTRKSLSASERFSISEQAKKHAERIAGITETDRNILTKNIMNEKTSNTSGTLSLSYYSLGSISKSKTNRQMINEGLQHNYEESIHNRVANTMENSLSRAAEEFKSSQKDESISKTSITSIVQKGINHSVGVEDIAKLKTRQSERMFTERALLNKFKAEIHSANLIFLLKMLMKKGRVQPDESLFMLIEQPFSSHIVRGDGYTSKGKHSIAADFYQKALISRTGFLTEGLKQDPELAKDDFVLADLHRKLGETKLALGKPEEAEKHYLESTRIHEEISLMHDPALVSQSYHDLGRFYFKQGKLEDAETWFYKANDVVNESNEAKRKAITGLIQVYDVSSKPEGVKLLVHHEDPVTRHESIDILAKSEKPEHLELIETMISHENEATRNKAIQAIAETGNSGYVKLIAPLLEHKTDSTKMEAVEAIGKLGQPSDAELLNPLLGRRDLANSVKALAGEIYFKLLSAEQDIGSVLRAISNLAKAASIPEHAETLKPLLEHGNTNVRVMAEKAIRHIVTKI